MSRFPTGKRRTYALLAAALIALTFGVTAGLTKSGPGQLKADILGNSFNKDCPGGYGANKKRIGVVTVIREKGIATFRGKLHGAVPGSYDMKLFNSNCGFLLKFGSFNVDGSGDANFAYKSFICPGQTYFLDFHNETANIHNSTKFFKIGSSGKGAPDCPAPGINIVKFTNGEDANDPPGPTVAAGSVVTFTYTVTNTGNVPLDNVEVNDDHLGTVTSFTGDTNGNGLLDTTETWTYTATDTATPGQYENVGDVTADSPFGFVADDDPSHYFGSAPGIHIVKLTNGDDANTLPGPSIEEGDPVTWTYVVTNTGNVPLQNVVVTDDQQGTVSSFTGDTNGNGLLDLSETWTYTLTDTAQDGPYSNIGTVNAESPISQPVMDDDPSNYTGFHIVP
jgi:uncharacterized repeat protein (TIGR01451 family)